MNNFAKDIQKIYRGTFTITNIWFGEEDVYVKIDIVETDNEKSFNHAIEDYNSSNSLYFFKKNVKNQVYTLEFVKILSEFEISKIPKMPLETFNHKTKYAIVSLLMMGDGYLPGILVVGKSIRNLMWSENIDMVCLVTPDISENARHDILEYYDRVIEIPYIEIPYQNIKHTNVEMQKIYAKTFTKLYTLTLIEYEKIVMIDADMIVLRREFFSLFDIQAPAGIFLGNLSAFKPSVRPLYNKVYGRYLQHGKLVPDAAYRITCDNIRRAEGYRGNCAYLGVETSICLLAPNMGDFNALKNNILTAPARTYKSDTDLISRYFQGKWRHIDLLYLGRWINPHTQPEYVVLDLYGMDGKPWQINRIDHIYKEYPDIRYWVDQYIIEYEKSFKEACISPQLRILYDYLVELRKKNS